MRIKTTTKTEYQQRINVLVEYINNHLGEDIDLNKLAEISDSLVGIFIGSSQSS